MILGIIAAAAVVIFLATREEGIRSPTRSECDEFLSSPEIKAKINAAMASNDPIKAMDDIQLSYSRSDHYKEAYCFNLFNVDLAKTLPVTKPSDLTPVQCVAILNALSPTTRAQIDGALHAGSPAQVKAAISILSGGLDKAGFHNEAECVRRLG